MEKFDGNTNVCFHQEDTLKRIFERLENLRCLLRIASSRIYISADFADGSERNKSDKSVFN